ncbi:uncharacterized protein N7479_009972 [Penicillium vulpinum]|uniref:uncharacterized protein n=1 Tax=Penicillium vulpinum TaxID=29845 RepID=UPI0025491D18|nr:uncharacterized protein N7479_009972 [Penicillium vulpinum]KAJ5951559.1 hypothetical protein N7479_009972 [Penicillium vulpinum]
MAPSGDTLPLASLPLLVNDKSIVTDQTFEVKNPATGTVLQKCSTASVEHDDKAVGSSQKAFTDCNTRTLYE